MFAIVDIETTGGTPGLDRITEIAVLVHNGKRIIDSFSSLVNPQKEIDPFVSALTGISNEMVEDAPLFEEIYPKIEELTVAKIFVAHNARFDYGIIRREYKRLGLKFQRKHLCTVKLSKKIFPGLKSYSLGRLCKDLDIPVSGRHRAFGDAEATTILFERLLFNDRKELIYNELENELSEQILPPNMCKGQVEDLPEETGVYYFLDKNNKVLYVGKSNNIRQRIISHFSSDLQSKRFAELKDQVAFINYELTGNDLIARLLESSEIKRFMPPFNRAQRRKKYRYGIYIREDEMGLKQFETGPLRLDEKPLIPCTSRKSATLTLERFEKKYQLNIFLQLMKLTYRNENKREKVKRIYENRMDQAIEEHQYPYENFFIIGEGLGIEESSIICIEQNEYKGYGYISNDLQNSKPEMLKEFVRYSYDTPDIKKIIKNSLKRNQSLKILPF